MKIRLLAVLLVLGLAGWLGLLAAEWKFGLGRFATSPQSVVLEPGRRAIVGGGRAVLGFVSDHHGKTTVELTCAAGEIRLELADGQTSGEVVCGVRVRPMGPDLRSGGIRFDIIWEPDPDD